MNIHDAARTLRTAEQEYQAAFQEYFTTQITVLPEDRFWQLQSVLVQGVVRYRFGYDRSNGVEQAARELFRKPLAKDFSDVHYTMPEAIRFAKTWLQCRDLYQPLFDVAENRSDDAFSDLLDALPLAGRGVVSKAMDCQLGCDEQLEAAVRSGCADARLVQLVLHGESYMGMSLQEAAADYLAISCNDAPQSSVT